LAATPAWRNCAILKAVTIGDSAILGDGAIVVKDVLAGAIVAGDPARIVGNVEDYCRKRHEACVAEAFDYAHSIVERIGRRPTIEDFWQNSRCSRAGTMFMGGHETDPRLRSSGNWQCLIPCIGSSTRHGCRLRGIHESGWLVIGMYDRSSMTKVKSAG
jgi:hypothetical protein